MTKAAELAEFPNTHFIAWKQAEQLGTPLTIAAPGARSMAAMNVSGQ